jgi:crossover junction endodeoxyribonuclease RuvC
MIILGIDPGVATTGYGIIENKGKNLSLVDYGCISTEIDDFAKRLDSIYKQLRKIIREYKPNVLSCEQVFFYKNTKTALNIGHARGVVLLASHKAGVKTVEYTPLQVKQTLVGYGWADKKQVQNEVKKLLKLDSIPKPDDAADALACAICHLYLDKKSKAKNKKTEKEIKKSRLEGRRIRKNKKTKKQKNRITKKQNNRNTK